MEKPFCMDALTSGIRSAISGVVQELAGLGLIKVLQNVVVTPGLVIIGCLSVITGDVITGLATSTLMLYLSDVAGIATPLISPSLRSMMSRMVSADRQGTLLAWIAMIESVCKCSAQMAFTPIYEATLPFMEGFVFLIVASTRVFIVIIQLLYIYLLNKSQRKKFQSVSVQTDIVVEVDDDTS
ncbi:hypothetical protein V1264_019747 [Littorina saxatilis]|uniref:Solute carrier family 46 member 3 n=1 Tax=Littorina saxatilis TaxID=31220 RepID=A0AAN9BGP6_9CAEN